MPTDEIFGGDPLGRLLKRRRAQADANLGVTPDTRPPVGTIDARYIGNNFFPQLEDRLERRRIPTPSLWKYINNSIEKREQVLPRNVWGDARDEFLQEADDIFATELDKIDAPSPAIDDYASALKTDVDEFYSNKTVQDFINKPSNEEIKRNVIDRLGDRIPDELKLAFIAGAYDGDYAEKYLSDSSYFRNLFQDKHRKIKELDDELENAGIGKIVLGELAAGVVPLDQTEGALLGASLVLGPVVGVAGKSLPLIQNSLLVGSSEALLTGAFYFGTGAVTDEENYRRLGQTSQEERESSVAELKKRVSNQSLDGEVRERALREIGALENRYKNEDAFVDSVATERLWEAAVAGGLTAGLSFVIGGVARAFTKGNKQSAIDTANKNPDIPPEKIFEGAVDGDMGKAVAGEDAGKSVEVVDTRTAAIDDTASTTSRRRKKRDLTGWTQEQKDSYGFWVKATDELRARDDITPDQAGTFLNEVKGDKTRNRIAKVYSDMPDSVKAFIRWVDTNSFDGDGVPLTNIGTKVFIERYGHFKGNKKAIQEYFNDQATQLAGIEKKVGDAVETGEIKKRIAKDDTPVQDATDAEGKAKEDEFKKAKKDAEENPSDLAKVDVETLRVDADGSVKYDAKGKEGDPVKTETVAGIEVHKIKVPAELHKEDGDKFIYRGFIDKPNADNVEEATNMIVSGGDAKAVALATISHKKGSENLMIAPQAMRIGNWSFIAEGTKEQPSYVFYDAGTGTPIARYTNVEEALEAMVRILDPDDLFLGFEVFTKCMTGAGFLGAGKNAEDVLAASTAIRSGTPLRGVSTKTEAEINEMIVDGVFNVQEFGKGKK